MKILPFSFIVAFIISLAPLHAQEVTSLPFGVTLGGQAATYTAGDTFAKVGKSVKSDADIVVDTKGAMTIINVTKADGKGQPVAGAAPAVILLQGTNKGTLAGTMDKSKLAPGTYLMSVVADGKTDSIIFSVE
jgi:hypothetical protein